MSNRKMYCLLSAISLILGASIYIFLRGNSYIGIVTGNFPVILTVRQLVMHLSCDFTKFYLADFLWGFSLCCGLLAIYTPQVKGCLICAFATILCGCAWELLQYVGIWGGTGDFCDMLMYFLAGLTCTIINTVRRKKHEKK